jgi:hypothetical protein
MFYQPWIKKLVVICQVIHIMPPVDTSYSVLYYLIYIPLFYNSHFKTSYKTVIMYVIIYTASSSVCFLKFKRLKMT